MKRTLRTLRPVGTRRRALLGALVLLVVASASEATADDGTGPLGVTTTTGRSAQAARVGALFPADRGSGLAGEHFCTASVVHSPHRNLIVTAAHCLDGKGSGDLVFAPGYRDGKAPHGLWKVGRLFLPDGWADGQDEDSDVAFAVVEPQGEKGIEDVVGANRFAAGVATGATALTVTGYPDSRDVPISCTNKPTAHSSTQQRIDCPDFSGGTSGSPWVNGNGQVVGVLGGHEQGGATDDISYSVVFGEEAAELYQDAASAP
ncbi:trypsin-like peptidase domain-containing protein [Streptomyces sp. NPDC002928]|uniref:trypsin-like serine peptidase n=1 Tax=Streptomyces sp. NPDC002928 TaxID=3154440 RepID=UPI0033A54A72